MALSLLLVAAPLRAATNDLLVTDAQLARLAGACSPAELSADLAALAALGSRTVGADGLPRALDWTETHLRSLGFEIWGRQRFAVTVPRDLGSRLVCRPAGGAPVDAAVYAVWPNFIAPPVLPPRGLLAPLVDGATGALADFDGKPLAGAIVLMDYASAARWQNAAAAGAAAVVFLPDEDATFVENMAKFCDLPVQFPRFYLDDADAARRLRAAAATGATATLTGGMAWDRVETENLVAFLPATAPRAAAGRKAYGAETAGADATETVMVSLAIDSASVVPGLAHGGLSAASLAGGLAALKALAAPELGVNRSVNLLVLVDSGRAMATSGLREFSSVVRDLNAQRARDWAAAGAPLTPRQAFLAAKTADLSPWIDAWGAGLDTRRERLRAAIAWMEAAEAAAPGAAVSPFNYRDATAVARSDLIPQADAGQWLRQVCADRVKQQQIATLNETVRAEQAAGVDAFAPDAGVPADVRVWRARKAYYRRLAHATDPAALLEAMRKAPLPPAVCAPDDVTPATLLAGLRARLAELDAEAVRLASSRALRQRLAAVDVTRNFVVDLSPGDSMLTLTRSNPGGDRAGPSPQQFEWGNSLQPMIWRNFEHLSIVANHALGAPVGAPSAFDFVGEGDPNRRASPAPCGPLDTDLSLSGVSSYTLLTGNDPRLQRMGPGDRMPADPAALANLAVQSRTVALLLAHVLQQPDLVPHYRLNTPWCTDVQGVVVKQDVRAGPFPNLPVPGALVVLARASYDPAVSSAPIQGSVFATRFDVSDSTGFFRFGGFAGGVGQGQLHAFRLDPRSGLLACAPDATMSARGGYETAFDLLDRDVFKRLVVFDGACVQLYDAVDPMLLQPLSRPGGSTIRLFEGRGGAFDKYYLFKPATPSSLIVGLVPPDSRLKALVNLWGFGNRLLLLGDTSTRPTGEGYAVGGGLDLTNTAGHAAEDLWRLNEARLQRLARKGVRANVAQRLHRDATADRARLANARAAGRYAEAHYIERGIWGRELNAYPAILRTTHEAVVAVVILLAFLAPWALFMERVYLQAGGILGRIAGAVALFSAAFALLYLLHPAFQISQTPIMILVAYALATLALLALSVLSGKYASLMRKWREQVGGIHQSDISRAGAFMVAFNLGLSNMARRRLRTTLTIVMIALLAFSVMTFTSIEPFLGIRKTPLAGVPRVPYNGVLFRLYNWGKIDPQTVENFVADLGAGVTAVRRMWHRELQPGAIEGPRGEGSRSLLTRLEEAARPRTAVVNCLLGFAPEEPRFSALSTCVTGAWFSGAADEVILPAPAAATLGIGAADVAPDLPVDRQVRVRLGKDVLRVVGILDDRRADAGVDLGGTPLSHVDTFLSGIRPGDDPAKKAQTLTLPVGDEVDVQWVPFAACALLPNAVVAKFGGSVVTVAAAFAPGTDAEARIGELMSRFAMNLYAAIDGRAYLVRSAASQSVSGAWKILLPLLLVVLIVVNLMLGTVDERQEEIKMLGAVGLAPRHVTILYLAESCCLGVMGLVFGVLLGLAVAVVTRDLDVGVNVNYASVPTMLMGVFVLLVVVVSTLIPAARAARLATPSGAETWSLPDSSDGHATLSLPFTMTRRNGVGIFAFLHEYLDGHWESTSPDFRFAELTARCDPDGEALVIAGRVWLAPYDMRVSQSVELRLQPAGADLFGVRYDSRQLSGELGAWNRANFTFIDLLRQQFLIYRTLSEAQKREYVEIADFRFRISDIRDLKSEI